MKLLGFQIPFTAKATDQNTVTPIRPAFSLVSSFGTIFEAFGGMWQRGLVLDSKDRLLAFSAVYACNFLISGDISKLRPRLMQLQASGIWEETDNSAWSPVLRKPNRYQTRVQFYQHWVLSKLIWGNTYALKSRNAARKVDALYILDPQRTTPMVAPDGEVFYQIKSDNLTGIGIEEDGLLVPASEVIHDRGPCLFHPLIGVPPLYACATSTSQGNRIQANSARFFENMSRPSGHLSAPGKIEDKDVERIKKDFDERFSGANLGKILVTGSDMKFHPMTMPAEQAQLIEQLKFTVEDVARAYLVPLYKIAAGQSPAYTNPAVLNTEYYQQTLQPHLEAIEILLDEALDLPKDHGVEFDLDGLLRMDPKSKAEADEIGVRAGILAPDEARRTRNLRPVPGGNTPYLQQQNFSLAALAKRDAQDDPFGTVKPEPAPPPTPEPANDEDIDEEEMAAAFTAFQRSMDQACATLSH